MKNSQSDVLFIERDEQSSTHPKLTTMESERNEIDAEIREAILDNTIAKAESLLTGYFGAYYDAPWDQVKEAYAWPWRSLISALVLDESLDQFRTDKAFKDGVQLAIEIETCLSRKFERLASHLIDSAKSDGSETDYRAALMLQRVLPIVFPNEERTRYHGLDPEDLSDIELDLKTIIYANEIVLKVSR